MFKVVCNEMSCVFMNDFTKTPFKVYIFVFGICKLQGPR